jgi:predicted TIM-barrel fold metal-dependent hydrolase
MKQKIKRVIISVLMTGLLSTTLHAQSNMDYLMSIKKFDIHTHIWKEAPWLRHVLDSLNMKVTTICTRGTNVERMNRQINQAKEFTKEYPRYYAWITTFDLTQRDDPNWADNVINQLKEDFKNGAIGVKVWKEIGMEIKNKDGKYIQIDDPMFYPIFDFLAKVGKPVLAHLAEPIQAWMPGNVESKPQNYWAKHPQYSFWDKPGVPSYSEIMAARDHVLERHPDLIFIGAHLGSLEFDVSEIIKRLDRYPNFAVEIGGRTRYFMWQARGKVRDFFIKYQDRIMYGTDLSGGVSDNQDEIESRRDRFLERQDFFFRYYATDDEFPWGNDIVGDKPFPEPEYSVKGLALPPEVLKKVFYDNAVKWFPGVEKEF